MIPFLERVRDSSIEVFHSLIESLFSMFFGECREKGIVLPMIPFLERVRHSSIEVFRCLIESLFSMFFGECWEKGIKSSLIIV